PRRWLQHSTLPFGPETEAICRRECAQRPVPSQCRDIPFAVRRSSHLAFGHSLRSRRRETQVEPTSRFSQPIRACFPRALPESRKTCAESAARRAVLLTDQLSRRPCRSNGWQALFQGTSKRSGLTLPEGQLVNGSTA